LKLAARRRDVHGRQVGNPLTARQAVAYTRLIKPAVAMPLHHDAGFSGHTPLWRATEPVFQAIKDDNPEIVRESRGYRQPVCFETDISWVGR
jgi:hypothetical protein